MRLSGGTGKARCIFKRKKSKNVFTKAQVARDWCCEIQSGINIIMSKDIEDNSNREIELQLFIPNILSY